MATVLIVDDEPGIVELARLYLEHDAKAEARRHVLALMKLRPWDRRALSAYLRSFSPA